MKKFVVSFSISLVAGVLLLAAFVALEDPFYHYHAPFFGEEAYMDNALYQTPGAAKNLKYDAVIIGSSMTENFRESWFEEMGMNLQKLSYSGAEFKDYERIFDEVKKSSNNVGFVLTDINEFQLMSEVDAIYQKYPEYIYKGVGIGDVQYLLNEDVFWTAAGRALERVTGNKLKKDDSYTWEEAELFSKERACRDYDLFAKGLEEKSKVGSFDEDRLCSDRILLAEEKMKIITDIVETNKDVTFVFYYPPYSTLFWDEVIADDNIDEVMQIYLTSMRSLLGYDNVYVFNFQDYEELVSNLERYRDVCHHDPQGNRFIYECIRDTINGMGEHMDEYRITEDNIDAWQDNLLSLMEKYCGESR